MKRTTVRLIGSMLVLLVLSTAGITQAQTGGEPAVEGVSDGLTEALLPIGGAAFGVDPFDVGTGPILGDENLRVGLLMTLRGDNTWDELAYIAQRTDDTWTITTENDEAYAAELAGLPSDLADYLRAATEEEVTTMARPRRTGSFAVRATEDAFASTTTSNGNRHFLGLGNMGLSLLNSRSYMKFGSLKGSGRVPSGGTATRARLSLWQFSSPSCSLSPFYMQRVTGNWSEGSINWGNQPGGTGNYGQQGWSCYSGSPVQRTWDFHRNIVNDMNNNANYGIRLINAPESGWGPMFCSEDEWSGHLCNSHGYTPLLSVDWELYGPNQPSIPTPTQSQVLTSQPVSVRVNGGTTSRGYSQYQLQVSTTSNFSNVVFDQTRSSTASSYTFSASGLSDGTLYARARVWDQARDGQSAMASSWSGTRTFTLNLNADLSVTSGDSPDPVQTGDDVTYTFTVTNNGPGSVSDATLTFTPDSNLSNISGTFSDGTCSGTTCALGAMASGEYIAVTVVGTVAETPLSLLETSATVSASMNDPVSSNNSVTEGTAVTTVADLSGTLSCDPTAIVAGETTVCTATVSNRGTEAAENTTLSLSWPDEALAATMTTNDGGICGTTTAGLSCNFGTLPVDGSRTITFDGVVSTAMGDELEMTLAATTPTTESTTDNNGATETLTVTSIADLQIAIAAPGTVTAESDFQVTLTSVNNGPGVPFSAGEVVLTAPDGVAYVDTPSGCEVAGPVMTCGIGAMFVDFEKTLTLDLRAEAGTTGALNINAQINATNYQELNPDNNTASATVNVEAVQVFVADTGVPNDVPSVTVPVRINCVVDTCASYQVSLAFDPAEVQVNSVTFGDFLTGSTFEINGVVDNTNGTVENYAASVLGTGTDTGEGTLLNLDVSLQPNVESAEIRVTAAIVTDNPGNSLTVETIAGTVTRVTSVYDVNKDGYLTPADVVMVLNQLGTSDAAADVDGDGTVTQADADAVMAALSP